MADHVAVAVLVRLAAGRALLTSYQTYDHLALNHDTRWIADFLVRTAVASLGLGRDR
jgi:hypothetical protein